MPAVVTVALPGVNSVTYDDAVAFFVLDSNYECILGCMLDPLTFVRKLREAADNVEAAVMVERRSGGTSRE